MSALKWYALNLLVAIDQLGNAIFGGYCDETISAHAWRLERSGKPLGRVLRRVIDFLSSPNHCARAYENERARAQLPPELR